MNSICGALYVGRPLHLLKQVRLCRIRRPLFGLRRVAFIKGTRLDAVQFLGGRVAQLVRAPRLHRGCPVAPFGHTGDFTGATLCRIM